MATVLEKMKSRVRRISREVATPPVGLDIGHSRFVAVQLRRTPGSARYAVRAAAALSREDAPESVGGRLNEADANRIEPLFGLAPFAGRQVVVAYDAPAVDIQALTLPTANRDADNVDVQAALAFELDRHVEYDIAEAEIRSWKTPSAVGGGPNWVGVCCHRKSIEHQSDVLARAGLYCRRLELGCLALIRACATPEMVEGNQVWGALDFGVHAIRLVLAVGATPVLHRTIDSGARKWTELVASRLDVSADAAERLKLEYGLTLDAAPRTAGANESVGRMIYHALRRELTRVATEVERSFSYLVHLYSDAAVGPLHLCGRPAGLSGLADMMNEQIGINIIVAQPSQLADIDAASLPEHLEDGPGSVRAVGLALLGAEVER